MPVSSSSAFPSGCAESEGKGKRGLAEDLDRADDVCTVVVYRTRAGEVSCVLICPLPTFAGC